MQHTRRMGRVDSRHQRPHAPDVRPKKRFGQNFLNNDSIASEIVLAAGITAADTVVEIGPGMGVLTKFIAPAAGMLYLVELDRECISFLKKEFHPSRPGEPVAGKTTLIESDAMKVDYANIATLKPGGKLKLAGNLPFNISVPLTIMLAGYRDKIESAIFMYQKEVAHRIMARPGGRDYGALSVTLQFAFDIEHVLDVPSKAFLPVPKVDATVLKLIPKKAPPVKVSSEKTFLRLVDSLFRNKRKTLRNNIKPLLASTGRAGGDTIDKLERHTGVNLDRRAETLSMEEFASIAGFFDNLANETLKDPAFGN